MKKRIMKTSALALLLAGFLGIGMYNILSAEEVKPKTLLDYAKYPDDYSDEEIEEIKKYGSLTITAGDSDGNGVINTSDLLFLKSIILSQDDTTLRQKTNSDINCDFLINILDYIELKKILMSAGNTDNKEYALKPIDAEKYLDEMGTVSGKETASSSDKVLTEKEVIQLLKSRGFNDVSAGSSFDMDGNYYDCISFDEKTATDESHPVYEAYYVSGENEIWQISVLNGYIFANPLIYNLQEDLTACILISETDNMISYDNITNQFFDFVPDPSEITIKTITSVTAGALEKLSSEELTIHE